jgi:hypothetical protein
VESTIKVGVLRRRATKDFPVVLWGVDVMRGPLLRSTQHRYKVQHCAMLCSQWLSSSVYHKALFSCLFLLKSPALALAAVVPSPNLTPSPSLLIPSTHNVVVVWTHLTAPDWPVRSLLTAARLYKLSRNKGMADRCFNTCFRGLIHFVFFVESRFVSLIRRIEMKQFVSV